MLRILRDDEQSPRVTLRLQGAIVSEWAGVLENECLELQRSGHVVLLDLSGVTLIGRVGLEVLRDLEDLGVEIDGCLPLMAEVLKGYGIRVGRAAEGAADEKRDARRLPGQ